MGEVKRYTLSAFMDEREDGLYVDREDYDAVERERDALRADLQATREALHEWDNRVGRLQDEVAALKAACAQKDGALGICRAMLSVVHDVGQFTRSTKVAIGVAESALSTDAGKGWIDATGAVEGEASKCNDCTCVLVPDDWAGSRVLVVLKP